METGQWRPPTYTTPTRQGPLQQQGNNGNNAASRLSPLSQPFTPSPQTSKVPYAIPAAYYSPVVAVAPTLIPATVLPAMIVAPANRRVSTAEGVSRLPEYHSISPVAGTTDTFRAVLRSTSSMVVLKKIGGGTTDIRIHQRVLRKWQWTRHPNIIPLNNFTVTSALSVNHTDECIAEYKYVADLAPVETIKDVVPEALVWSIAVQLASAIRHVHYCGTALRCINPSMVCLGSWGRVYITSVGSAEISQRDTQPLPPTEQQQARDLEDLGQLLLSICACYQVGSSVETLLASPHYTLGLKHFVVALLPSNPTRARGITRAAALWDMLGERVSEELSTLTGNLNSVLQQQMQHMHSSRALRVLIKLGFVLDRPEYEKDLRWGESGDRYILKLFRSYVFHQNDDSGVILDWGHVACCLHKLDVGSEEKLLLLSKDDTSVVVTSFQEMRHLMEAVFLELQDASRSRATIPQQR